jgi:hypothetical protein
MTQRRRGGETMWAAKIVGRRPNGHHPQGGTGMITVLVHWTIHPGQDDVFLLDRPPVAPGTPGFIGEELYRIACIDGEPDGSVNYVNIAVWESEGGFRKNFGVPAGSVPPRKPYEAGPRRREFMEKVPLPAPTQP